MKINAHKPETPNVNINLGDVLYNSTLDSYYIFTQVAHLKFNFINLGTGSFFTEPFELSKDETKDVNLGMLTLNRLFKVMSKDSGVYGYEWLLVENCSLEVNKEDK